jgi:hypothetical protein
VPVSRFREPDLDNSLTSIACFGDDRITNLLRPLRLLFRRPTAPSLPP